MGPCPATPCQEGAAFPPHGRTVGIFLDQELFFAYTERRPSATPAERLGVVFPQPIGVARLPFQIGLSPRRTDRKENGNWQKRRGPRDRLPRRSLQLGERQENAFTV